MSSRPWSLTRRAGGRRLQLQNRSLTEPAARTIEPLLRRSCSMRVRLQYAGTCKDDVKPTPQTSIRYSYYIYLKSLPTRVAPFTPSFSACHV